MFASEIEWTYPSVEKSNTGGTRVALRKKLKSKHLDFEDKYIKESKNQKKRTTNYDNYCNMEESSTRAQERHAPVDHKRDSKRCPQGMSLPQGQQG